MGKEQLFIDNIPNSCAVFPCADSLSSELMITYFLLDKVKLFFYSFRAQGEKWTSCQDAQWHLEPQGCCICSWSWGDRWAPESHPTLWGGHHTLPSGDSGTHLCFPPLGFFQVFPCLPCLSRSDLLFSFAGSSVGSLGVCVKRGAGDTDLCVLSLH